MEDFFELVSACTTLSDYIDEIARRINNPLWIMDAGFHIEAMSHNPDAGVYRKKFDSEESLSSHVSEWDRTGTLSKVSGSHSPVRLHDDSLGTDVVIMDVFSGAMPIGRMTIFEEHRVSDEMVIHISMGAGIYMRTINPVRNHAPAEQMLADLIDGEHIESDVIRDILKRAEIPEAHLWRMSALQPAERSRITTMYLETLRNDLERSEPSAVTLLKDQCIYVLASDAFRTMPGCRMGYSIGFTDLNEVRSYALQARFALEHADHGAMAFENLLEPFITDALSEKINPESLVIPSVRRVMDYDKEYGTQYFETLKAYYGNNESKAAASRVLHIHLNTVKYRMNQMNHLFGIDPDKDAVRISISLSILNNTGKGTVS